MYVVVVHLHVHAQYLEAFLPLMTENARLSLANETGCHQFDILYSSEDATRILLYEIYNDRQAFDTHLSSPHYLEFSAGTNHMMSDKQVQTYDRIVR